MAAFKSSAAALRSVMEGEKGEREAVEVMMEVEEVSRGGGGDGNVEIVGWSGGYGGDEGVCD